MSSQFSDLAVWLFCCLSLLSKATEKQQYERKAVGEGSLNQISACFHRAGVLAGILTLLVP